ncbi:ABC transporter permease [Streptococcus moroccensis]|uniref:ABC transport system permease protein n=1 Tax=Streptococcus moroccensis TaxID=1451356 RepID=A0ABT9YP96_9STRE|nr:FtsX-like permease family protein [Streptococcus moroccensis]MDQ0221595.1 putative ABC transport system permease protein [Streptococcus moroccensis]
MFGLIRQLAVSNLVKNRSLYYPFALATSLTVAIFYIFVSLAMNPNLKGIYGGNTIVGVMGLGLFIVGLASVAIITYANSFVMKNRTKELGLYEILGLNKGHLVQMAGLELFIFAIMSISLGLVLGLLLDQLIYAILLKLMDWEVVLASTFQWTSVFLTVAVFAGIFTLTFVLNTVKLLRLNALELNRESKKGEKKGRFLGLQTLFGLSLLGAGYYLANTVKDPVAAITIFFGAVLLVMAATYLLFNAGVTVFLRFLKKREGYYYQPKNFISTSNLIFRMKKNAMGLATIAILSTMVLVTLAGGSSIYMGTNAFIGKSNPHDFALTMAKQPSDPTPLEALEKTATDFGQQKGVQVTKQVAYRYASGSIASMAGNTVELYNLETPALPVGAVFLVETSDYEAMTGDSVSLASDEVMIFSPGQELDANQPLILDGKAFTIATTPAKDFVKGNIADNLGGVFTKNLYLVVSNLTQTLEQLPSFDPNSNQLTSLGEYYYVGMDSSLDVDAQLALEAPLNDLIAERFKDNESFVSASSRARNQKEITSLFGSLFFIGILLTIIFMLGTVLVIYYKQVSEGYEDRENFVILQKVGLDESQTRQTIRKQVLVVFLLPLICSFVHLAAAFKMLDKILHLFVPMLTSQILQVTLGVCGAFLLVYLAVFAITSRSYRKIVSR